MQVDSHPIDIPRTLDLEPAAVYPDVLESDGGSVDPARTEDAKGHFGRIYLETGR